MQIALVAELRQRVISPARLWFVPNGGNLSRVQRGQFRDMGLTAGVHDLHFIWCDPFPQFATIELKHGKGDTTDGQDEFTRELTLCGHRTAVCWSHDEAIDVLTRWGFPLRRAI